MKRILLILYIITQFNINSIEYNNYEMEVEHVFNASHMGKDSDDDLSVNNHPIGPEALGPSLYIINDSLIIGDQVPSKKRVSIILDQSYNFINVYDQILYNANIIENDDLVVGYGDSYIKCIDLTNSWNTVFNVSINDFIYFKNYKDLHYQDNTLFIYDKNYKLWAIRNPGLDRDENRKNIINEEDIIEEIKSGKYEGLTIDDKKRLFKDSELQTVNIKRFFEYYDEQISDPLPILNKKNKENFYIRNNAAYIGRDEQGFSYWYNNNRVLVVDDNQTPINDILLTKEFMLYANPAVSPEGDIFFMEYGIDKVTLYKINRQW